MLYQTLFFNLREYRSRRHVTVEISGDLVPKPHTLKCCVMSTETKLADIKQVSFISVSLDYFQNNFHE
jgi:hypothetical protein